MKNRSFFFMTTFDSDDGENIDVCTTIKVSYLVLIN